MKFFSIFCFVFLAVLLSVQANPDPASTTVLIDNYEGPIYLTTYPPNGCNCPLHNDEYLHYVNNPSKTVDTLSTSVASTSATATTGISSSSGVTSSAEATAVTETTTKGVTSSNGLTSNVVTTTPGNNGCYEVIIWTDTPTNSGTQCSSNSGTYYPTPSYSNPGPYYKNPACYNTAGTEYKTCGNGYRSCETSYNTIGGVYNDARSSCNPSTGYGTTYNNPSTGCGTTYSNPSTGYGTTYNNPSTGYGTTYNNPSTGCGTVNNKPSTSYGTVNNSPSTGYYAGTYKSPRIDFNHVGRNYDGVGTTCYSDGSVNGYPGKDYSYGGVSKNNICECQCACQKFK